MSGERPAASKRTSFGDSSALAACGLLLARLIVGGVFVYAGFLKASGQTAEFAGLVAAYKILPAFLVVPFATGLPYVEMWVGLFILAGLYTRYAAVAAGILNTIFLAVLLSTFARGIDLVSCGCFGADALSPRYTLILDGVLIVLSLVIYRLGRFSPRWSLDQTLS